MTDTHRRSRQILFDNLFDFYDDDDEDNIDDDQYKRSTETERPPMSLYYHKQNAKPILIRRNVSTNAKTYKPIFTFTNMTVRPQPNNLTSTIKNIQQIGRTNKTLDKEILRDFYDSHKESDDDVFVLQSEFGEKMTDDDDVLTYDTDQRINDVDQNPNYNININIQYFLQTTGRPTTSKISKPIHNTYIHPIKHNVSIKIKPKYPIQTIKKPLIIPQTIPVYGNIDHHMTKPPKKSSTSYPIYVIQTSKTKYTTTNKPEGYDEVPIFVSRRPSGLDYVTTKRPYVYRPQNQQTVTDENHDPVYEDLTTRRPNRKPFPTQRPNIFGPYFFTTQKMTTRPVFPSYLYLTKAPTNPIDFSQRPNQQVQKIDGKLNFKNNLLPDRFKDWAVNKDFVKISSSQSLVNFHEKEENFVVEKRKDDFEQDHPDFLPVEDGLDVVKVDVMPSEVGSKVWATFNTTEEFVNAVPELDVNINMPCATELPRPMNLSERKPFRRRS